MAGRPDLPDRVVPLTVDSLLLDCVDERLLGKRSFELLDLRG